MQGADSPGHDGVDSGVVKELSVRAWEELCDQAVAEGTQEARGKGQLGVQLERVQVAGGGTLRVEQLDQQLVHTVLDGVAHPGGW